MGLATLGPYRMASSADGTQWALRSDSHRDAPSYRSWPRPHTTTPPERYASELPWFAGMVLLNRLFPLDPTRFRSLPERVRSMTSTTTRQERPDGR